MTPDEIERIANERYKLVKGMCRRERETLLRLRRLFIEKESKKLKEKVWKKIFMT